MANPASSKDMMIMPHSDRVGMVTPGTCMFSCGLTDPKHVVFVSVAVTVMGNVPDCVGVPLSKPLLERVMPLGSAPVIANV